MNGERLTARPRVLNHRRLNDINHLLNHVEFAQSCDTLFLATFLREKVVVFLCYVPNVAQPVIDQTQFLMLVSSGHTAATIVATNNDVLDFQNIHGHLQHRQAIQVCVHDQIRDVTVYKHFTRNKSGNLVCRNTAV